MLKLRPGEMLHSINPVAYCLSLSPTTACLPHSLYHNKTCHPTTPAPHASTSTLQSNLALMGNLHSPSAPCYALATGMGAWSILQTKKNIEPRDNARLQPKVCETHVSCKKIHQRHLDKSVPFQEVIRSKSLLVEASTWKFLSKSTWNC